MKINVFYLCGSNVALERMNTKRRNLKRSCRQTLCLLMALFFCLLPLLSASKTSPSHSRPRPGPAAQANPRQGGQRFSQPYTRPQRTRGRGITAPCHVFLWDVPSAIRYHLCKRLLRGNVYEGLGGTKFVRIKPNSVLESLYPPSRHGPDRCLICKHSFGNHLQSWWFPNLYSPYDMYLDDTKARFTCARAEQEQNAGKGQNHKRTRIKDKGSQKYEDGDHDQVDLALGLQSLLDNQTSLFGKRVFHKRYAKDVTLPRTSSKRKGFVSALSLQNKKERTYASSARKDIRSFVIDEKYQQAVVRGVKFQVPAFQRDIDEHSTFIGQSMLLLTRVLVLDRLHSLIIIQDVDNKIHS